MNRNYGELPHAFNLETIIAFDLPAAQQVVIRIYDLNGREIATLTNGHLPVGC